MIQQKEFYFIRHGKTDYNTTYQKIDHEDVSLNGSGLKEALKIEPLISKLPIKTVCCSPLKRAKDTKEIVSTHLVATHHELVELGECTHRIWRDMLCNGAEAKNSREAHVRSFIHRAKCGLNKVLSLQGPSLIVSHGGIHWAFCCLMELSDHNWVIDNCIPVHFFPDTNGKWKAQRLI